MGLIVLNRVGVEFMCQGADGETMFILDIGGGNRRGSGSKMVVELRSRVAGAAEPRAVRRRRGERSGRWAARGQRRYHVAVVARHYEVVITVNLQSWLPARGGRRERETLEHGGGGHGGSKDDYLTRTAT